MITRYFRGDAIDQLIARIDGTTPRWYLADEQGSINQVVDNAGIVKDALTYDAWGNILTETNSAERGRYAWTGREVDAEIALQFNRARYYDATTGRWITQDPLGFDAGDSNLYRYVNNGPTIGVDPSGLDRVEDRDDGVYWVPTGRIAPFKIGGNQPRFVAPGFVLLDGNQFANLNALNKWAGTLDSAGNKNLDEDLIRRMIQVRKFNAAGTLVVVPPLGAVPQPAAPARVHTVGSLNKKYHPDTGEIKLTRPPNGNPLDIGHRMRVKDWGRQEAGKHMSNLIAGLLGLGSDPNAPVPMLRDHFDSPMYSPSMFFGGGNPHRDITKWFDDNAAGHVKHAKTEAEKAVDKVLEQEFKRNQVFPSRIDLKERIHSVRPDHDNSNTPLKAIFAAPANFGETRFGDRRQTPWEANGSGPGYYEFHAINITTERVGNHVIWKGNLVVKDWLGISPGDFSESPATFTLGKLLNARNHVTVIRANWPIHGKIRVAD